MGRDNDCSGLKTRNVENRPASIFKRTALASAVSLACGTLPGIAIAADESAGTIEEVVVTATRRANNLQDVPLSIQAITDETIENLDISRFEDIANLSPSISYISAGPGNTFMFIRGIADGSNPNRTNTATATMYLDDAPLTYSGGIADLHNYDIERIEILNGPQGTYYGASATSGTVRIITKKPDPEKFDAGADISYGSIERGDGVSTVEGFVNIPVQEGVSAIRLVGWYDKSDGFVDNVNATRTYLNGVTASNSAFAKNAYNEEETKGIRGSFKTPVGDRWSAMISGFVQESETSGAWDHDPTRYDELEVARFGPEFGELSYGQVAWTVEGDLGFADIIYSGSFLDRSTKRTSDYSDYVEYASFGSWIQQFACDDYYWYGNVNCNDPSMFFEGDYQSEQTTHEVRVNSNSEGPLSWIAGAYFEDNTSDNFIFWDMPGIQHEGGPGAYYTSSNGGDPLPNEWWSADWESEWKQTAFFGEVSYDINDRLTATVGARMFESEFSSPGGGWAGYFYDSKASDNEPGNGGKTDDVIYKVNLTYDVSDNLLTYFNYAEGFRPGGGNTAGATNPNVPETYQPDVLDSYELGWKLRSSEGQLTFNGAIYHMEWTDFQTSIYDLLISPLIFRANAGNAEVDGIEAELNALLTPNLTIGLGGTYNKSQLTKDFNSTVDPDVVWAPNGRRLPYSPEFRFSGNARYTWNQSANLNGYAHVSYSYTGRMWNLLITEPFQADAAPKLQDSYAILDMRVGWELSDNKYGFEFYATNLTDERAQIFINTGSYDSRITTNRPRTLGFRVKARLN
jgi:outer membrane receptor protein involved in Fe transport